MAPLRRRLKVPGVLLLAAVVLSACATAAPGASGSTSSTGSVSVAGSISPPLPSCDSGDLPTRAEGALTIAMGSDATAPWAGGGSPPAEGLETSVGRAVASALGYSEGQVIWSRVDHAAAQSGTAIDFDLAIDRFVADDPVSADYSTGYFAITDSLIRRTDGPAVSRLAQLGGLRLTAVGSTVAIAPGLLPSGTPQSGLTGALAALRSGSVDAVVIDTPTALTTVATSTDLAIAGQLPTNPLVQPDQFHIVLPRRSALTGCVSTAVDRLRVEGTLDELSQKWVDPLAPPLAE